MTETPEITVNDLMVAHALMQDLGISPATATAAQSRRVAIFYRRTMNAAELKVHTETQQYIERELSHLIDAESERRAAARLSDTGLGPLIFPASTPKASAGRRRAGNPSE